MRLFLRVKPEQRKGLLRSLYLICHFIHLSGRGNAHRCGKSFPTGCTYCAVWKLFFSVVHRKPKPKTIADGTLKFEVWNNPSGPLSGNATLARLFVYQGYIVE